VVYARREWACSSAGEHYVDIVGVTGSIPVTPTIRTDVFGHYLEPSNFSRTFRHLGACVFEIVDQFGLSGRHTAH
jgi:hypothetical protein